ncbi:hypothetical protein [Aestuariimicrobium ganziense]|uniref:hypothetical protein n=1 Tax=Aestuariimicrobium ganziense TaxID=2773677 RepID=UPI0019428C4D|nr:hypothetical protein [Aestuariimicrobium ganziense]
MDQQVLRSKIMGCWLGKAASGTLGQSCEGAEGPLDFRPDEGDGVAEWVIGLAEVPSYLWIPGAFS